MSQSTPPRILGDRYELRELIAEGGHNSIWRAWDRFLNIERAIKVLSTMDATARTRLKQEAKTMAALGHAHILPVYDLKADGDELYVVMSLAKESLADRVKRDGSMPAEAAVLATIDVLDALQAAHAAGVVHRDVKPHNVLVNDDGDCLLADFGIARFDEESMGLTRTGTMLGSLAYMPPEQRVDPSNVGPAVDLYATGAMLYQLISGASPMDLFAEEAKSARWHAIPESVRPVLVRACDSDPSKRYASAAQMTSALRAALIPLSTRPPRTIMWMWGAAATCVIIVGVAIISLAQQGLLASNPPPIGIQVTPAPQAASLSDVAVLNSVTEEMPQPEADTEPAPSADSEPPAIVVERPRPPTKAAQGGDAPPVKTVQVAPAIREIPQGPPSLIDGRWRGALDGRPARLTVQGTDAQLVTTLRIQDASHPLDGTLTANQAQLSGSTGRLNVRLEAGRLVGTWTPAGSGELLSVTLKPAPQ